MQKIAYLIALALITAIAAPAHASEPVKVTKLRSAKVMIFDAPEGTQIGEALREQYTPGTWTVRSEPQRGYVQIAGNGTTFWVKNFAIDTDRRISSSAECGVKLAGSERKMGATRGLGEECK